MPRRVPPLNASKIASIKAPATGRIELYDGQCPGLILRLPASGAGSWSFKFWNRQDNKQERLTLGLFPAVSLARARDLATKARGQLLDGVNPAAALRARQDVIRFDAAVTQYLAYLDSIGKPSRKNDRSLLSRPKAAWGRIKLDQIDRRMVAELVTAIGKTYPRTGNALLTSLKSFFAWAVDRAALLRENPIAGMRPLFKTAARERVLTPEEIRTLWAATGSDSTTFDRDTGDVLRLLLLTGQRSQQLRALRREEILELDGPAPRLAWSGTRMKAGKAQSIPLVGMALTIVREALQRHPGAALFRLPQSGKQGLSATVAAFLCPAEGGWTPHDLRRTHLTIAAELGVPEEVRAAVASHSSGIKSTYDRHSRHGEMLTAFAAIEQRILEITGERPPKHGSVVPLHGSRRPA